MKKMVSQLWCSKCKTPIKHAFVENCPNCGSRLTANYVSKRLNEIFIITSIGLISCFFYFILKGENLNDIIFPIIVVSSIIGIVVVPIYIINKKKLKKDKEYIDGGIAVKLEVYRGYADVKFEKKYFIIPVISLISAFSILGFLIIDVFFYGGSNSYHNFQFFIYPAVILLVTFFITAIYASFKINTQISEVSNKK